MKNKKAVLGDGILMIYRLTLVGLIAFAVLGVSAVFYDHFVDVHLIEAQLMTRNVVDCLAPEGTHDPNLIKEEQKNSILDYCGFSPSQTKRFYVEVKFNDEASKDVNTPIIEYSHGDSSLEWVKDIFKKSTKVSEVLEKYRPGYYTNYYSVNLLGTNSEAVKIQVEVIAGSDE